MPDDTLDILIKVAADTSGAAEAKASLDEVSAAAGRASSADESAETAGRTFINAQSPSTSQPGDAHSGARPAGPDSPSGPQAATHTELPSRQNTAFAGARHQPLQTFDGDHHERTATPPDRTPQFEVAATGLATLAQRAAALDQTGRSALATLGSALASIHSSVTGISALLQQHQTNASRLQREIDALAARMNSQTGPQ